MQIRTLTVKYSESLVANYQKIEVSAEATADLTDGETLGEAYEELTKQLGAKVRRSAELAIRKHQREGI
jgi:hypothetical protein